MAEKYNLKQVRPSLAGTLPMERHLNALLQGLGGGQPPMDARRSRPCEGVAAFFRLRNPRQMTGRQPGHDGGGLGLTPIRPSAKRALLLPAWPERKLYPQAAGFWACGLQRHQGVLTGGVRPFSGLARPGSGAVGWHRGCSCWVGGCCCVGAVGRGPGRRAAEERTRRSSVSGVGTQPETLRSKVATRRSGGRGRGGWQEGHGGRPVQQGRWHGRRRAGGASGSCGEAAGASHGRCRPAGGGDLANWQRLAVRLAVRQEQQGW
jgi:hypothetical protein